MQTDDDTLKRQHNKLIYKTLERNLKERAKNRDFMSQAKKITAEDIVFSLRIIQAIQPLAPKKEQLITHVEKG